MSYRSILTTVTLFLVAIFLSRAQETKHAKAECYIKESESLWAEADVKRDTAAIEPILADDFLGVAPDGSFYDKAKEIANVRGSNGNTISNYLNEVNVKFYGDKAVAQGSESWERRSGEPRKGEYVWADTWVHRNGQWQIVAAEDVMVPEKGK